MMIDYEARRVKGDEDDVYECLKKILKQISSANNAFGTIATPTVTFGGEAKKEATWDELLSQQLDRELAKCISPRKEEE